MWKTLLLGALCALVLPACVPGPSDETDPPDDDDDDSADDDDDDSAGDDDDDSADSGPFDCSGVTPHAGVAARWEQVGAGFALPLGFAAMPPHPMLPDPPLFVVERGDDERPGTVRPLIDGAPGPLFLEVEVDAGPEGGLLGLVFAPDFATSGLFYIKYTVAASTGEESRWDEIIEEWQVDPQDPLRVLPESRREVLRNGVAIRHHGGAPQFGLDGYLYLPFGDGDIGRQRCSPEDLRARILRIDPRPDGDAPYRIPPDNPFVGHPEVAPETFAWGFRNPWTLTVDALSGDIWVGDVGLNAREEIDLVEAGLHYGWPVWEGNAEAPFFDACPHLEREGMQFPVFDYAHGPSGGSVTGGFVYRGCALPDLHGQYIFARATEGTIWRMDRDGAEEPISIHSGGGYCNHVAFGQDNEGELYVTRMSLGEIWKLVPG